MARPVVQQFSGADPPLDICADRPATADNTRDRRNGDTGFTCHVADGGRARRTLPFYARRANIRSVAGSKTYVKGCQPV